LADVLPHDEPTRIKEKRWPMSAIREVHSRRYLLRRSALEIFLVDQTNHFFNFSTKERSKVYRLIVDQKPPNLAYTETRSPEEILSKSGLTRQWQQRQISNFEYLMQLNTIAGRTYNDLTQYPVFPWILADYKSASIDLNDETVYRDLSKPVGALNPKRLQYFVERYEGFESPDIPKFHYGSHYSTAGSTIFYCIRLEPFTKFGVELQGGMFDKADRLFDSVEQTFDNVINDSSDVKELIPEFFYQPEIFRNANKFYFGRKQGGRVVDDVILPAWAHSPEEFVRINRAALESEYVSNHLHEWIDLIFGFKQRGQAAVDAHNVFYFLTYEGMVDIDAIEDEAERRATEAQINNFGQTPVQLLKKPHPRRLTVQELAAQAGNDAVPRQLFENPAQLKAYFVKLSRSPLIYIGAPRTHLPSYRYLGAGADVLVTVDKARIAACHRWLPRLPSTASPFTFEPDAALAARRPLAMLDARPLTGRAFALTPDGRTLLSGGHWDNSVKCIDVESSKIIQSVNTHKDVVSCVVLGEDGRTLVTGSVDTTVVVWKIQRVSGTYRISDKPQHVLYGHDDEVTALAVSTELDLCVSGSADGSVIFNTLRRGNYVRSVYHPQRLPITLLALASDGSHVSYSSHDLMLRVYSVNGRLLCEATAAEQLSDIRISADATMLVTGSVPGKIVVRRMHDLSVVHRFPIDAAVECVVLIEPDNYVMVGLRDGKLLLLTHKSR